jgi:hypothetical protein
MENPYTPPSATVADVGNSKRAKSPKVIGIILLILSVFGIIGLTSNVFLLTSENALMANILEQQGLGRSYYYFSLILGTLTTFWLLYISIQLIKYHDVGRKHFNYYLIFSLISGPLNFAYQMSVMPEGTPFSAMLPGMFGAVIALLFYVLGWYYLNKAETKASLT